MPVGCCMRSPDPRVMPSQYRYANGSVVEISSGKTVLMPHAAASSPEDVFDALVTLVVPPFPSASPLFLCTARFIGHMFLVLKVAPAVLDIMRATFLWGMSLQLHGWSDSTTTWLRNSLFVLAILYTVTMLFVVSVSKL